MRNAAASTALDPVLVIVCASLGLSLPVFSLHFLSWYWVLGITEVQYNLGMFFAVYSYFNIIVLFIILFSQLNDYSHCFFH